MLLVAALLAADVTFTAAVLRVVPELWDKQANLARLERCAREAAGRGARLVVAPEGFLEGYVGNHHRREIGVGKLDREKYFAVGERIDSPLLERVRALARELKIHLVTGFAESRGGRMYNSLMVVSPEGRDILRYSKTHCGGDAEPYNTEGSEFPVVDTPLGRWGALICLDRQLPETSRILAIKGAQVILNPSYGGYGEMNDVMMRTRACENSVWVIFAHPRRALIIDPGGTIVAQDSGDADQVVTGEIRLDSRVGRGAIRFRRPEIYGEILNPKR